MKVLVTGGAGFIGSHVVDELIQKRHKVVVIDDLSTGKNENINRKAKLYKLDICSPKIAQVFKKEKFDAVFHLAAQISAAYSMTHSLFDAKVNVLGTINLIENSLKYGVKKFIYTSSGGVLYGNAKKLPTPEDYPLNPICPYGVSKLTAENYLRYYFKNFNFNFIALRYGNVYGPRQDGKGEAGVVAIFIENFLAKKPCIVYGDGNQTRDYVYVKDVARANVMFLETDTRNWKIKDRFLNVGTEKEITVNNIYQILKLIFNSKTKIIYQEGRMGDIYRSCLDASKIKKLLKWKPKYIFKDGIKETVKWFTNKARKP
jgi:UDP-glucose 4-epimerase